MKKYLRYLFCSLAFIAAISFFSGQAYASSDEKIDDYSIDITINEDSSLSIAENINYDFGANQKHGVFRKIPIKYNARGGNYNVRVSDISVSSGNNKNYPYEKSIDRKYLTIKVGDPNATVFGKKHYKISYTVNRAINYFFDHDELYWNAIGTEWEVPISTADIVVHMPKALSLESIKKECFAGEIDSSIFCRNSEFVKNTEGLVESIDFKQSDLLPNQGLTVVVGLPKGIITEPSAWQKLKDTIKDNIILGLPILVLMIMLLLLKRFGKDAPGRGTIIPEYDPPLGLSPIEVGTIIDERVDNKDISADIINLAVKGYLKITRVEKNKLIGKSVDYQLDRLKKEIPKNPLEAKLIDSLFDNNDSIKLSDLKNKFYKDLGEITSQAYSKVTKDGYFAKNPATVRIVYIVIAIIFAGLGLMVFGKTGAYAIISFTLSGLIIAVFGYFMPAKTTKGTEIKDQILGLKLYLSVAEKERIKFHNAPEKSPKKFEQLLPYAMVLGVEKEWAKQFEGIYKEPPSWYSGNWNSFNTYLLISSLNDFSASAKSTLAATPSSAAGGGSGFSGGGVGGGFGGGGGGSW